MKYETWIRGDGNRAFWHVARESALRGAKTGTVIHRFVVTACSGRQVGGAAGASVIHHRPRPAGICPQCATLASEWRAPR